MKLILTLAPDAVRSPEAAVAALLRWWASPETGFRSDGVLVTVGHPHSPPEFGWRITRIEAETAAQPQAPDARAAAESYAAHILGAAIGILMTTAGLTPAQVRQQTETAITVMDAVTANPALAADFADAVSPALDDIIAKASGAAR